MKALDQWARSYGYNDFDTFVRAGGSRREAFDDLTQRIQNLQAALDALIMLEPSPRLATKPEKILPALNLPDVPDAEVDKPDPANAQIQGAELG